MDKIKKIIKFSLVPFLSGAILIIIFPQLYFLKLVLLVFFLDLLIEFKIKAAIKNRLPKESTHDSSSVIGYGRVTSGDRVRLSQYLLKDHGYDIAVDGIWGPKSESATKAFQQRIGLCQDGLIGKHTWAYLIEDVK